MSHDVRPSLNCRTHERTFFTSITPSLHVSLNCRWTSIGFMPRKWRNRIITRCSSNVNVAISVSETLLQQHRHKHSTGSTVLPPGLAQPKEQPRLLQQLSRFYLLPFPRKKIRIRYNLNAPRVVWKASSCVVFCFGRILYWYRCNGILKLSKTLFQERRNIPTQKREVW